MMDGREGRRERKGREVGKERKEGILKGKKDKSEEERSEQTKEP